MVSHRPEPLFANLRVAIRANMPQRHPAEVDEVVVERWALLMVANTTFSALPAPVRRHRLIRR
jgi:hypothetical protein